MSAAERAGVVTPSQTDVPTGAPEAAVRKKGSGRKKHTFTKTEEQLIRYIAAETALRGSARPSHSWTHHRRSKKGKPMTNK